jgi:hypothetical protein
MAMSATAAALKPGARRNSLAAERRSVRQCSTRAP